MSIFVCEKCGSQFPKWLGQCAQCGSWGTVIEEANSASNKNISNSRSQGASVLDFETIKQDNVSRIKTNLNEVDRVLGGGVVPFCLILLGGQPGIGKSTLILQIAGGIKNKSILYVSGEESAQQIKMRFDRLNLVSQNWKFLGETDIDLIENNLKKHRPDFIIIDSIQTLFSPQIDSESGSINQVRACTSRLRNLAKETGMTVFIIGHVTKEGVMAGPRTLEHLVDVVLYLEGDPAHHFRFLRAVKNRFGSTNEVGVFDMKEQGLIEVTNPSEIFLSDRDLNVSGSLVVPVVEGSRSFLVEVQALVSRTSFGYPQRKSNGFDLNRLSLLIAVLMKRCRINLNNQDIHINVVGGLQVKEPAVDLGISLAIVSAFKNKPFNPLTVAFGEVGLGGEVRGVKGTEKRIKESLKMGFKEIICPDSKNSSTKDLGSGIKIIQVKNLSEVISKIF